MNNSDIKKFSSLVLFSGIAVGSAVLAYHIVSDKNLMESLASRFHSAVDSTINKTAMMSEEAAARTAEVTKNPDINKNWVANQWEQVGY